MSKFAQIYLDEKRLLAVIQHFYDNAVGTELRKSSANVDFCDRLIKLAEEMKAKVATKTLGSEWLLKDLSSCWRVIQDMGITSNLYIAMDMAWIACLCASEPSHYCKLNSHERQWLHETFNLPHYYPWIDLTDEPGHYTGWCNVGISGVYKRGEPNPLSTI